MKFAKKLIILVIIAAAAMIWGGVRNSCCESGVLPLPLAFIGGILGWGGEKAAETSTHVMGENSAVYNNAVYAATKGVAQGVMVTFIELGSVNCIPCKMMQPVMRQVEQKYGGQVKILFYDVWTSAGRPYAQKYGIQAIPTQVFLDRNGKEYFRHIGYFPFEEVEQVLKKGGVR
jgi:thioredoxin 1